jgi:hypothetical protein
VAAEACAGDDAITGLKPIDPVTNALHLPSDLVADDAWRGRSIRVDARPGEEIGEVDPRRLHGDANLVRPNLRIRALLDF